MRFEVLTAASMKMAVFWVIAPCSLVEVYQYFRGTCCLHHHGSSPFSFGAENGDSMFLWNVGIYLQVHTALQSRRQTLTTHIQMTNWSTKCLTRILKEILAGVMKHFQWQLQTAFDSGGSYTENIFFDFPKPVFFCNNIFNSVCHVIHQIHATKTGVSILEDCRESADNNISCCFTLKISLYLRI
jgi:hypothetical protein